MGQVNDDIRNVHVAASEIDGQLLLLHKIKDGAASSSFGLHVAKMAGIPAQVLNDAQRYLMEHLATDHQNIHGTQTIDDKNELGKSVKDKRPSTYLDNSEVPDSLDTRSNQLSEKISKQNQLFSLQDELEAIDPDSLTPKQAHDLLYQLKKTIGH